jgi:hypothetical protein
MLGRDPRQRPLLELFQLGDLGGLRLDPLRRGLFVHLTAPAPVIRQRLLARDGQPASLDDVAALVTGYQRVFTTLADYTKLLALDTTALELPSAE